MNIPATTPEVRFNLKSHKGKSKSTPILIIAVFRYEGKRLVYTTGEKCPPKYWNSKTMRAKESVDFTDTEEINDNLDKIRKQIRSLYKKEYYGKGVEIKDFKLELDYSLNRKPRPEVKIKGHYNLYEFIEKLIKEYKKNVEGLHGQTWQKFKTVYNHIKTFGEERYQKDLDYDDITIDFKDEFVEWLRDTYGHSENNISKIIRVTKQFLKESMKYHNNPIVINDRFAHSRVKVPKNFPTLNELKKLLVFSFEKDDVQKAIDLYLISAFGGGLRWSDIDTLSKKNEIELNGRKVIQVFTYKGRDTKSDNEVVIPILPQLRILLDKYKWNLPKVKYHLVNDLIREGFEEAQLNRGVLLKSGVKGEKPVNKKLYEVLHFHTARYAYINFMINDLDVSAEKLAKITGQSIKILLQYEQGDKTKNAVNVADEVNAKIMGLSVIKNEAV